MSEFFPHVVNGLAMQWLPLLRALGDIPLARAGGSLQRRLGARRSIA
ncbi:MAG TPA: hypothetical protein VK181_17685 [Rhizobium sp.]|nr:hypothetical protein [Rhizobium sp.]